MLSKDFEGLVRNFDKLVESRSKTLLAVFLRSYRDNPTKQKFFYLIMNMPIGFILKSQELEKLIVGGKIPKYSELLSILRDKKQLVSVIKDTVAQ